MSDPTVSTYWNQTTPAPSSGMQAAVIQSDGATPQDSRTISVPNTGGAVPKTGSYTAAAGDCGKLLSFNSGSAVTCTLPATPPSVGANQWWVDVENIGAGTLTLQTTSGAKLDGTVGGSLAVGQHSGCRVFTNGTDYYTQRGVAKFFISKVVLVVDGGGTTPGTGSVKRFVQVDFAGTILGWAAFADQSGTVSVDVWKKAGTAPPTATAPVLPTASDKISATAPAGLSSAQSAAGGVSEVSTWTTAVAAGDTFGFFITSASTLTAFTIELYIQRS